MSTLPEACDYCTMRFPTTPAKQEHTLHVHRHRLDTADAKALELAVYGEDT